MKLKPTDVAVALVCLSMAANAVAVGKAPRQAARADLVGFAIGAGDPALALQVELIDGKVASSAPTSGSQGNLRAMRSGDASAPMLTVSSELRVAVKFDLYLSSDGKRFVYTSSCALTPGISSFEMWQQPVREFALGNPRVVEGGKMRCD